MRNTTFDDGYVEDSEGEGDMMMDYPVPRKPVGGLPPPPPLPAPGRTVDNTGELECLCYTRYETNHSRLMTVSTIQTPDFTTLPPGLNHAPQPPPKDTRNTTGASYRHDILDAYQ